MCVCVCVRASQVQPLHSNGKIGKMQEIRGIIDSLNGQLKQAEEQIKEMNSHQALLGIHYPITLITLINPDNPE